MNTFDKIVEIVEGDPEKRIRSGAGEHPASVVFSHLRNAQWASVSIRGNIICSAHRDGLVKLDSCGWHTVTTSNGWRLAGLPVYSEKKRYVLGFGDQHIPFDVSESGRETLVVRHDGDGFMKVEER